ncbi:Ger(x)C family spore germination protein [Paenibacillus pasadenensis]|uniref:Ger(x)C family spore germination protein n=1 Tax=Paenibacillus pasadenensis TaxID=217090 RepID=UPI00203D9AAD|nr:Ger(x)C family spore germination protein [Paenibacillus pasadenensis]MCM3745784.1 Ger(x)C family spore germination protein [Paenibacillus pasadenensis]
MMRRLLLLLLTVALAVSLLPGCSNSRDIQSLAYVSAIGLDYQDGKYQAYVQVLNFSNIASSETVMLGKPVPVWIGRGVGETISGALAETNATSQSRLFWGHVKAVIVTERMMERGVYGLISSLVRDRQGRYTALFYGTRENLEEIMVQKSIFNLSPLDTMMFTAVQLNTQKAYILPMKANEAFAYLNEPGGSGMLPEIGLNRKTWHEDRESKPMFIIKGAFFFDDHELQSRMSMEQLKGMRWRDRKLDVTPLKVNSNGRAAAVLMLGRPDFKIKVRFKDGQPKYDISIKTYGYLSDLIQYESVPKLQQLAQEAIKQEVLRTYKLALANKSDCYRLQLSLYRRYPRTFNQLTKNSSFTLDEQSISSVKVKVFLRTTGKFKGNVYSEKYKP